MMFILRVFADHIRMQIRHSRLLTAKGLEGSKVAGSVFWLSGMQEMQGQLSWALVWLRSIRVTSLSLFSDELLGSIPLEGLDDVLVLLSGLQLNLFYNHAIYILPNVSFTFLLLLSFLPYLFTLCVCFSLTFMSVPYNLIFKYTVYCLETFF